MVKTGSVTVREALAGAVDILRRRGIETPRLDAEVLLAFVLGTDRTELYINSDRIIDGSRLKQYFFLVERRAGREPVAYITGQKEFMSLIFHVNRDVLIPRPETEVLVEWIVENFKKLLIFHDFPIILDVGTGSGALAVSLAKYVPQARVWALDISEQALEVARGNARRNGVADRIVFVQSDLLAEVPTDLMGKTDLIVANLPYVPTKEIPALMPEITGYEPYKALDGGGDGLDLYRKLIPQAHRVLRPGGWLGMEMGEGQSAGLASLLPEDQWGEGVRVLKDYTGRDRFIIAKKNN